MLLRLKTTLLRCCLTEVEKQAELVAKFGEYLKSACRGRHSFLAHHPQVYRNTIYYRSKEYRHDGCCLGIQCGTAHLHIPWRSTGQSYQHTTCQETLAHHGQYHLEPCSRFNRMWFAGGQ